MFSKSHIRLLIFIATLVVVAVLHKYQFLVFFVLAMLGFLLLYIDNFRYIKSYIAIAIAGPASEILCIYGGAWTYASPDIFGVPVWLPLVWGNCGICLIRIAAYFKEIKVK